jgi:hypothetical protein
MGAWFAGDQRSDCVPGSSAQGRGLIRSAAIRSDRCRVSTATVRPLGWDMVDTSHWGRACTLVYLGRGNGRGAHLRLAEAVADSENMA